jgi:hypothetical protein
MDEYGRPDTSFFALAVPIPGRERSSVSEAELMSIRFVGGTCVEVKTAVCRISSDGAATADIVAVRKAKRANEGMKKRVVNVMAILLHPRLRWSMHST